ncbi:hypothetical protein K431DRAFT_288632 [Polychaeton citri CBS 116435]|uniref:Uncharacterized protein n=1 Tax=Polychaeton citri CBS 116435 TaxID=1314669 RepID=A0A9P4ULV2_9PEZI|nr:hypothetical protein K431DRAFT_288632 [Polychaeton citri CBS 116435]
MCKAINIRYSCKHSNYFRLSTCRGMMTIIPGTTFEVRDGNLGSCIKKGNGSSRVEPIAACTSAHSFTMRSARKCGGCQLKQLERSLQARLEEADQRVQAAKAACQRHNGPTIEQTTQVELAEALRRDEGEFRDQKLFDAKKMVGSKCNVSYGSVDAWRRQKGQGCSARRTSLLRREVFPQDVPEEKTLESVWRIEEVNSTWGGPVEGNNKGALAWDDDKDENTFAGVEITMYEDSTSSEDNDENEGDDDSSYDWSEAPAEREHTLQDGKHPSTRGTEKQTPTPPSRESPTTEFQTLQSTQNQMLRHDVGTSWIGSSTDSFGGNCKRESRRDSVTELPQPHASPEDT